jgi:hypothetical protein
MRLPAYLAHLNTLCSGPPCVYGQITPAALHALQQLGFSLSGYAALLGILTLLSVGLCLIVAAILSWRKSRDWWAIFGVALFVGVTIVSLLPDSFNPVLDQSSA